MRSEIIPIVMPLPHGLGTANCFLIRTAKGFILVDAGFAKNRAGLDSGLERAGCRPGDLSLILITHADGDHTGNAAHIRKTFGGVIALHPLEAAAAEGASDLLNRTRSRLQKIMDKAVLAVFSLFIDLGKPDTFKPDLLVTEGFDLSPYGLDARVLHLPGHSRGSIGVLDAEGNLFCGDLLWNRKKPGPHLISDNKAEYNASLERLRTLDIATVYPGHGEPFPMEALEGAEGGKQ